MHGRQNVVPVPDGAMDDLEYLGTLRSIARQVGDALAAGRINLDHVRWLAATAERLAACQIEHSLTTRPAVTGVVGRRAATKQETT